VSVGLFSGWQQRFWIFEQLSISLISPGIFLGDDGRRLICFGLGLSGTDCWRRLQRATAAMRLDNGPRGAIASIDSRDCPATLRPNSLKIGSFRYGHVESLPKAKPRASA